MSINAGPAPTQSVPGLTLKAWALVSAANVLIKGFNVSSTIGGALGAPILTFTNAMSSANYLAKVSGNGPAAIPSGTTNFFVTAATGSVQVLTYNAGNVNANMLIFVEIYE